MRARSRSLVVVGGGGCAPEECRFHQILTNRIRFIIHSSCSLFHSSPTLHLHPILPPQIPNTTIRKPLRHASSRPSHSTIHRPHPSAQQAAPRASTRQHPLNSLILMHIRIRQASLRIPELRGPRCECAASFRWRSREGDFEFGVAEGAAGGCAAAWASEEVCAFCRVEGGVGGGDESFCQRRWVEVCGFREFGLWCAFCRGGRVEAGFGDVRA